MKIGLLGQFGTGNSGNDGSLEAILRFLRGALPEAELLCICPNPRVIEARYQIRAISVDGGVPADRSAGFSTGVFGQMARRLLGLRFMFTHLAGLDLIIVPGTGVFDDFQDSAFGWPFVIYRWCLAARLRNVKVAFVSVGAGPASGQLTRWFFKSSADMADYSTYRDRSSIEFMKELGLKIGEERQFPDLAFSLPNPVSQGRRIHQVTTVGVGVMNYRGWSKSANDGDAVYEIYINKLTQFVRGLVAMGYHIRLLTGDAIDKAAVDDLARRLLSVDGKDVGAKVAIGKGGSLQELMQELNETDIAVVSRYHNALCALKLGKPTLSLGYAPKNDDLLSMFGLGGYCHHIETFDVDLIIDQFKHAADNIEELRGQINRCNEVIQLRLAEQQRVLLEGILKDGAARRRAKIA